MHLPWRPHPDELVRRNLQNPVCVQGIAGGGGGQGDPGVRRGQALPAAFLREARAGRTGFPGRFLVMFLRENNYNNNKTNKKTSEWTRGESEARGTADPAGSGASSCRFWRPWNGGMKLGSPCVQSHQERLGKALHLKAFLSIPVPSCPPIQLPPRGFSLHRRARPSR